MSVPSVLRRLITGDRAALASAITLVESQNQRKRLSATELVDLASIHYAKMQKTSLRVAITGAPGAGKSCLLENIGMNLISRGRRVAVLAIDPSSPTTKGSLLG